MRTVLGGVALCVVAAGLAGSAAAKPSRPKLAALILKTGSVDEELADNLTEVLISRLARRGDHEIAGKEELKTKLGVDDRMAADCMSNADCLGRVGTELGVTTMVVGTLGKRGDDYAYNLNLINIETGQRGEPRLRARRRRQGAATLIAAVQSTADKLLEPKIEPGAVRVTSETRGAMVYLDEAFMGSTPVRRDGVEPGAHSLRVEKEGHVGWAKEIDVPAAATLEVKVPLAALAKRRTWPALDGGDDGGARGPRRAWSASCSTRWRWRARPRPRAPARSTTRRSATSRGSPVTCSSARRPAWR